MSVFGVGLHVIIALFFAIHAVRSGQQLYWLFILFAFPLFGSIAYFFAIFLPSFRSNRALRNGISRAATVAVSSIDPGRDLRNAKAAYDFTPTAQNQWRYADALLAAGQIEQAVEQFEQCLRGPFANDLEIQFAAANAQLRFNQPERAKQLLCAIRDSSVTFRAEAVTLTLAQIYALQGDHAKARIEFEDTVTKFGSVEARAEYAIWCASQGDLRTAQHYYDELTQLKQYWNNNSQQQYAGLMRRLAQTLSGKLADPSASH